MTASKIEWTDRSDWNPVRGCTRVSPGCGGPGKHGGCYAEAMAARFSQPGMWGHGYAEIVNGEPRWTGKVELQEDRLTMPLSWRKPAKVFPNSTSDFFHEALPDEAIDKIFAVMALTPHLTYQVLTKRPERMRKYFDRGLTPIGRTPIRQGLIEDQMHLLQLGKPGIPTIDVWPLPNVWLGTSAERQQEAEERVPHLLRTPAAIRFVSAEPLLGELRLDRLAREGLNAAFIDNALTGFVSNGYGGYHGAKLDWVIAGGESGPRARPMHPDWARSLRDQCDAAGVPFFFKQWGEWAPVDAISASKTHALCGAIGNPPHVERDWSRALEFFQKSKGIAGTATLARLGKAHTGALLDGREHKAFPVIASEAKQSSGPPVAAWWW